MTIQGTDPSPRRGAAVTTMDSNDRWGRWVAAGAEHERGMNRRATFLAVLVAVSLAVWATLSIAF